MLLPEQKSMAAMKTLLEKYSQLRDLVYDPFEGSYATGRAFFSLPLHHRCIIGNNYVD